MHLTFKLLEEITRSLRSDDGDVLVKRSEPRVGLRARAHILPVGVEYTHAVPLDVWVRNLSSCGIGLVTPASLPPGTLFLIRFSDATANDLSLQYQVAHTTPLGGGSHAIGAVLRRVLPATSTAMPPLPAA